MTKERLAELMVRAADGLLPDAERQELHAYLAQDPMLQGELEAHMTIKAVTDGWTARLDADLAEDRHQAQATTRWEARIGVGLLVVGLGILMGFGLIEALLDPEAPLWLRAGLGLTTSGTIVLLFSVVRWRLATYTHDAYREIVR
jgi:anti-sigma factor RsiW